MMRTRNGHEIEVVVSGRGGRKELTDEEFSIIIDTKTHFKDLLASAASRLDAAGLALLISAAVKSISKKNYIDEKKALLLRKIGFGITQIEINYMGKHLRLEIQEKFLMQVLYQIGSIFVKNSYMANEKIIMGKDVVDAGANFGIFSFLAYCLGARKIYAFEPVKPTFEIMDGYVRQNGLENTIIPINKALGDVDRQIQIGYDGDGDLTASLLESAKKSRTEQVWMVALDSFFKGSDVSFIKIDTEGYEAEIISGGVGLVSRCKPAMCLSAYHKKEDRRALPDLIMKIRPDYKLEFINFGEENLFCT